MASSEVKEEIIIPSDPDYSPEKMSLESYSDEQESNFDESFQEFASMDLFDFDDVYPGQNFDSETKKKKPIVYSSDEDDELELDEVYQENSRRCRAQIVSSGGFDLDDMPGSVHGNMTALAPDEDYEEVCSYSELAIDEYNLAHNTNYEFVKYVKGVWALVAGFKYYLTFEAKEPFDDDPTTFQALVYNGIPKRDRTEVVEVDLVRKKSHATEEDNKILLCCCN